MSIARGVLWVLLAAAVSAALWAAGAMVLHLDEPAYQLGPVRVAVVAVAALAVVTGARVIARSAAVGVALLALLTAVCAVFTVLGAMSVGILALPFVVLFAVLLARGARREPGYAAGALGAAFLIALGLGAILLAQPHTALVRCRDNGASTSSRFFDGGGSASSGWGTVSLDPAAGATGTVDSGGVRYAYACRDGKLVDFRRVSGSTDA